MPTSVGRGISSVLAAALPWLALTGCSDPEPPPRPRDVLLITIDTARADRFSYTGQPGPGTPRIDALADDGAGFSNAISPVPLTLPAHASLMTGRQPPSHTVRDNGTYRLPSSETTLAEVLSAAGFSTGAFVGAEVLDARYGLGQGFATYDDEMPEAGDAAFLYYPERNAEAVVETALRWLDAQQPTPVFAWVHLFDPHTPYRPPEPERSVHASSYDGEIAYADRMVGKLLDGWEARRGLDRTLVIVTSDHGESLGEHGENTHGVLVYEATLRVPLVIRAPGLRVEKTVDEPVHLIDIFPTVLSVLGLTGPDGVQGRDLSPVLHGNSLLWQSLSGYAESLYAQLHHGCAPLTTLRDENWKLVVGVDHELYDLGSDPAEKLNLADAERDRTDDLSNALADLVSVLEVGQAELVSLDDETRRKLGALGYVWSTLPASTEGKVQRDPREALRSMQTMADADRRFVAGDVDGAIAGYHEVIELEPRSIDARVRLAQILLAVDRGAEAVTLLAEAVTLAPHEPFLHRKLGRTLEDLRRYVESLAAYDAGLARHADERSLRDGRWRCLNQLRHLDVMLAEADAAVAADPTDGMARFARAVACCGSRLDAYISALEREIAALPGDPILLEALAQARRE